MPRMTGRIAFRPLVCDCRRPSLARRGDHGNNQRTTPACSTWLVDIDIFIGRARRSDDQGQHAHRLSCAIDRRGQGRRTAGVADFQAGCHLDAADRLCVRVDRSGADSRLLRHALQSTGRAGRQRANSSASGCCRNTNRCLWMALAKGRCCVSSNSTKACR